MSCIRNEQNFDSLDESSRPVQIDYWRAEQIRTSLEDSEKRLRHMLAQADTERRTADGPAPRGACGNSGLLLEIRSEAHGLRSSLHLLEECIRNAFSKEGDIEDGYGRQLRDSISRAAGLLRQVDEFMTGIPEVKHNEERKD